MFINRSVDVVSTVADCEIVCVVPGSVIKEGDESKIVYYEKSDSDHGLGCIWQFRGSNQ